MRWWLFLGVAHETPRMRYLTPAEWLARLYMEFAREVGTALLPSLRRVAVQWRQAVDAFVAVNTDGAA